MWLGRVTKSWFPFINDVFGVPAFLMNVPVLMNLNRCVPWATRAWGRSRKATPSNGDATKRKATVFLRLRCWKMRANDDADDDDWHDSVGGGRVSSPSRSFGWTSVAFSSPSSSFGLEQGIYEGTWIRALGERVSLHYSRRTNSQQQPVVGRSENWTGWALYVND